MKKQRIDDLEIPDIEEEKVQLKKVKIGSETSDSKFEQLSQIFEGEREYWSGRIERHSDDFKDLKKITNLQAYLYYDRQVLIEQKHKLIEKLSKINSSVNKEKRDSYHNYRINNDMKLNKGEINMNISADLAARIEIIDLMDNHVSFLDQTVRTIDNIIFGIKYRFQIEELVQR